jgi:rSAM/selenodomain-associated transferase 1
MIVVMTRVPVPGATKTRLVPALGEEGAARLAEAMAVDVLTAARSLGAPVRVALEGPLDHPWARALGGDVEPQCPGDLGARLTHALRHGGVAIGTDAPTLPARRLDAALRALRRADVVLAPAEDGGYVLVGCHRPHGLFDGVPWSAPHTLVAQRARARALGLAVRMLPGAFDVDTPADLLRLRRRLGALPSAVAPRTRAFLESLDAAALR